MSALCNALNTALPELRPDQLEAVSAMVTGFYRQNLDDYTRHLPPEEQSEFNFYRHTLEHEPSLLPASEARSVGLLAAMLTENNYLLNFTTPSSEGDNNDPVTSETLSPLIRVDDHDYLRPAPTIQELEELLNSVVPQGVEFFINGRPIEPGTRLEDALDYLGEHNDYNDNDYEDYDTCFGCIEGLEAHEAHTRPGGCCFKPICGIDY
jgi:hypothetical protein